MRRLALALLTLALGCATRATPYRFRAPLLSGVHADAPDREPGAGSRHPGRSAPAPVLMASSGPFAAAAPEPVAAPVAAPAAEPAAAPAQDPEPGASSPEPVAEGPVLTLVGERSDESSTAFAVRAAVLAGADVPSTIGLAPDGATLLEVARADGLLADTPDAGDLVVFDDGWLVGAVTSVRADGTVEFVYLLGDVARRGYVNPRQPSDRRDSAGRALNTFVRPWSAKDPADQQYLAGELLTGFVSLRVVD